MRASWRSLAAFAIAFCLLMTAVVIPADGQRRGQKIKAGGVATQIDSDAGTFLLKNPTKIEPAGSAMPPFSVVTSKKTKFKDRRERKVKQQAFFDEVVPIDEVWVEGHLEGSVIVAKKVEFTD
jgi:hypothetical protein